MFTVLMMVSLNLEYIQSLYAVKVALSGRLMNSSGPKGKGGHGRPPFLSSPHGAARSSRSLRRHNIEFSSAAASTQHCMEFGTAPSDLDGL